MGLDDDDWRVQADRERRRLDRRERLRTIAMVATPIITAVGIILTILFTR